MRTAPTGHNASWKLEWPATRPSIGDWHHRAMARTKIGLADPDERSAFMIVRVGATRLEMSRSGLDGEIAYVLERRGPEALAALTL